LNVNFLIAKKYKYKKKLCRGFDEPQGRSGCFGELKILLPLLEVKQKFLGCPFHRAGVISTDVCRLAVCSGER